MNERLSNEIEDFREFKKNYVFVQKEIVQDGEDLYCDGELLQMAEEKPIGESTKWINVGYNLKGSFSRVLSNLFHYEFMFRGKKLNSIESFFQGIKFENVEMQNMVFEYSGMDSNSIKAASGIDWKADGLVYWQGEKVKRDSKEYDDLVNELYIAAIQNPLYRNVLKKVDRPIIHSIGELDKNETVFTRYEFEYMLNCLVDFLKRN